MMMMFISAVPVREEAAAQTPTVAEISPVKTAPVVSPLPLYQVRPQSPIEFYFLLFCLMARWSVPMVEVIVGSLCLLSPGCVEVGTGLSSALSLLLIISVS